MGRGNVGCVSESEPVSHTSSSLAHIVAQLGPKPCTRPDGTPDWGPEQGPRWKHCSRQASSTSYETTDETETTSENMEYAVSSSESSAGEASTSNITSSGAAQGFQLWMLVIAGTVASALVAMRLGQQKGPVAGRKHDMSGSVTRRVGAVGAFAAGLFPSNRAKEVEMNASRPEYKLDMSDDGNHPSTSAMV